jgi:hypothetical protein
MDVLFAIEREINGKTPQERVRVHKERSRPLVRELETWLREQRAKVSKNSEIGKAIEYSLKRRIIRQNASPTFCPGIGSCKIPRPKLHDPAEFSTHPWPSPDAYGVAAIDSPSQEQLPPPGRTRP